MSNQYYGLQKDCDNCDKTYDRDIFTQMPYA